MTGTYIVGVNYGNKIDDETSLRVILVNGDQTMFVNQYHGKTAEKVLETLVAGDTMDRKELQYGEAIKRLEDRIDYLKTKLNIK